MGGSGDGQHRRTADITQLIAHAQHGAVRIRAYGAEKFKRQAAFGLGIFFRLLSLNRAISSRAPHERGLSRHHARYAQSTNSNLG